MAAQTRTKQQILALMRRLGKTDRIDEARQLLPDLVDLDRDGHLLTQLGISVDSAVNELGGSPY